MARRKEAHGGGHGWFVTFADLMGLLVSFFVMLVAFSNQDARKMQAVTGSMREAFGMQKIVNNSGLMEIDGLPTRDKIKHARWIEPRDASITPTPDERSHATQNDQAFMQAAASLRRALQDMPELAEASKHIMIEESKDGLNIELVNQDIRPMFANGSSEPYEQARALIQAIAKPLKDIPYRVAIIGHTSSRENAFTKPADEGWTLSIARANAVQRILEEEGYPSENIFKVAGKASTDPLFPEEPSLASNQRVTIILVHEAPPAPPGLQP